MGYEKRFSWPLSAMIAVWLSIIFTLYMAPSIAKLKAADLLVLLPLFVGLTTFRLIRPKLVDVITPVLPLIALLAYVVASTLLLGDTGVWKYAQQLMYGFASYALLYLLFTNLQGPIERCRFILIAIFVLPGVVHLGYMYLDIGLAIHNDQIPLMSNSRQGLLEYIKESPRVGRRYVSVAMLHLFCGAVLIALNFRSRVGRYCALTLMTSAALSLALLDARAAYASVIIGIVLTLITLDPKLAWREFRSSLPCGNWGRLFQIGFLAGVVAFGYNTGKSRWAAMSYSVKTAVHDVHHSDVDLALRPYVNAEYWSAPIENIDQCYLDGDFRCKVDQSAYLRMSWMLVVFKSLVDHPLGIGYSENYLGSLWGVAGDERKFQRSDSFLGELIVSFGVPGIALCCWLCWGVMRTLRHAVKNDKSNAALILVCGIVLVVIGRGLVDVISEGLWRYFMALLGVYYGLLHSSEWQTRK